MAAPRLTEKLIRHYLLHDKSSNEDVDTSSTQRCDEWLRTLTPRERDVFLGIVRGKTNAEIGADLFLAESTVKSHINSIFAKLHVRDRVHAVILGYEWGCVPN